MKTKEFRAHLTHKFPQNPGSIDTGISVCLRIESSLGDLDEHFANDRCEKLMFLLTYTAEDNRQGREAMHLVPSGGDIYTNTATFKKWIKVYKEFCEKESGCLVIANPTKNIYIAGYEQTRIKNERDLYLRQIDYCFETEEELDHFFVDGITDYAENNCDIENIPYLSYQYFKNVEGEWYFRSNKTECYVKIVPSKISESSSLKVFFHTLFERNSIEIENFLNLYLGD